MISLKIFDDSEKLGAALADEILIGAARAADEGRAFVVGCPAGRSLKPTYEALAHLAAERRANLAHLHLVLMDEFVKRSESGDWRWLPPRSQCSCTGFIRCEVIDRLNSGLPISQRIPITNLHVAEPRDPLAFESKLQLLGGIDLFLLASGATDGHVAFNPPGTPRESDTRIVELAESTRRDALMSFPDFASLDDVPKYGVSIGLGTIARYSRDAVLVMTGEAKADSLAKIVAAGRFDTAWPASFIHCLPKQRVMINRELARAAGSILTEQWFHRAQLF